MTAVDASIKSSLPPRKRARTQEEKEQRRVERILRNRRAAHASREKKRRHVEFLEAYVLALEKNASILQSNFSAVCDQLGNAKVQLLSLPQLEDLSSLRTQIHLNMSTVAGSRKASAVLEELNNENDMDNENENDAELDDSHSVSTASMGGFIPEPTPPQDEVKVKEEHQGTILKLEENDPLEPPLKKFLSASPAEYFNYLLPVSMNSPVNSPIDLTLKKSDGSVDYSASSNASSSCPATPEQSFSELLMPHFKGSLHDPATSSIDSMAQNSAAILSPQIIAV